LIPSPRDRSANADSSRCACSGLCVYAHGVLNALKSPAMPPMTKLPSFARATGAEGTSPLILKLPSLASILSAVPPTASATPAPTPLATPEPRLTDDSVYFERSAAIRRHREGLQREPRTRGVGNTAGSHRPNRDISGEGDMRASRRRLIRLSALARHVVSGIESVPFRLGVR
jgi:hypothetical protein